MAKISRRLRASVGMDAINGDSFERSVCAKQMTEAANAIDSLERERDALRGLLLDSCCHSHGEAFSDQCKWCVDTRNILAKGADHER